jgi:hypothetical protein
MQQKMAGTVGCRVSENGLDMILVNETGLMGLMAVRSRS